MDNGLEQNQFAGSPEQKLPARGRTAPAPDTRPLAERALDAAGDPAGKRAGTAFELSAIRPLTAAQAASSPAGATIESSSGNSVRTAEQLLQNVNREVAQFKRFNAESMAVVLKPDNQTEIFLHLASRNGQIEIQARFERGDFAALNGQWSQLQQTLSQQGIRLSSLQEGFQQAPQQQPGGSPDWGHGQMNQGQQRPSQGDADERTDRRPFEEFVLPNHLRESGPRPERHQPALKRATSVLEAWA